MKDSLQTRRDFLKTIGLAIAALNTPALGGSGRSHGSAAGKPNFVIDQGSGILNLNGLDCKVKSCSSIANIIGFALYR